MLHSEIFCHLLGRSNLGMSDCGDCGHVLVHPTLGVLSWLLSEKEFEKLKTQQNIYYSLNSSNKIRRYYYLSWSSNIGIKYVLEKV